MGPHLQHGKMHHSTSSTSSIFVSGPWGLPDTAIHFPGEKAQYVRFPTVARMENTNSISVSFFVKDIDSTSTWTALFEASNCRSFEQQRREFFISKVIQGGVNKLMTELQIYPYQLSTFNQIYSTSDLSTDQWNWVAYSFDGATGTAKLYLNGIFQDETTTSFAIPPWADFRLGAPCPYYSASKSYTVSCLSAFDRALNLSEFNQVKALCEALWISNIQDKIPFSASDDVAGCKGGFISDGKCFYLSSEVAEHSADSTYCRRATAESQTQFNDILSFIRHINVDAWFDMPSVDESECTGIVSEGRCFYLDNTGAPYGTHGCTYAEPTSRNQLEWFLSSVTTTTFTYIGYKNPSGQIFNRLSDGELISFDIIDLFRGSEPDVDGQQDVMVDEHMLNDGIGTHLSKPCFCEYHLTKWNVDYQYEHRSNNFTHSGGPACLFGSPANDGSYGFANCYDPKFQICQRPIEESPFNTKDKRLILESDTIPARGRSTSTQFAPVKISEKLYNKGAAFICEKTPQLIHSFYPSPSRSEWNIMYDGDISTCFALAQISHYSKAFEAKFDISKLNKETFTVYIVGKHISFYNDQIIRSVRVPNKMSNLTRYHGAGTFNVCSSQTGLVDNDLDFTNIEYDVFSCSCAGEIKACQYLYVGYQMNAHGATLNTQICEIIID